MGKVTLVLALCVLAVYSQAASSKVSEGIQQKLRVPGAAPQVMVIFKDNSVVYSQLRRQTFANDVARHTAVIDTLKAFAKSSQRNAIAILNANPKTASAYKSFWITNRMSIDGADAATISHLVGLPEVLEVREPKIAHITPAVISEATILAEWGIETTNAHTLHEQGNTGAGVVVSNIDTGVLYTHVTLKDNFRADLGWYDPYTGSQNPVDGNGHGTHTMGTIAGSLGIGMAPGSQWIACRGCDTSSCTENALLSCGEFIACPHPYNNPNTCDVTKKPHVVNNSWGGGQGDNWYDDIIAAWIAVDIVPVFSNGNSVAYCGTANSPADNTRVIGVGATDSSNTLSYFSSCGPASNGGHIKPDISAPGEDVRSASNSGNSAYATMSGTSMAGPHVAGGVALYLSAKPNSSLEQVKNALYNTANRSGLGQGAGTCSGVSEGQFPNHSYGHGILNILAAVSA